MRQSRCLFSGFVVFHAKKAERDIRICNAATVTNLQKIKPEEPLWNKCRTGFLLLIRLAFGKHQTLQPPNNQAQAAKSLLAPLNFSTPFCKVRYQKQADFAERCCYFCRKTAQFCINREIPAQFSVFHKKATAFSVKIRGPPSEI